MAEESKTKGSRPPWLEVELVAGDPGDPGRSLQLTRHQALLASALVCLLLVFSVAGVALAIPAALALLDRREYDALISERSIQGERLQTLIGALETVGEQADRLTAKVSRIRFAYDLADVPPTATPAPDVGGTDSIYAGLLGRGRVREKITRGDLKRLGEILGAIETHEESRPETVSSTPSISPLRGATFVMTSPFGTRRNPFTRQIDLHAGLDLAATTGTPILAPADGVVTFAGRYQMRVGVAWWRFGNLVVLRHDDRYVTLFGHCDEVKVRRGQKVQRGDLVATVGNSGWSTNPHLHYEVRRLDADGRYRPFDPRLFILDQSWRDEDQMLIRAEQPAGEYQRLPRSLRR